MPPKRSLNDTIKKHKLDNTFKPWPIKRKIMQSEARLSDVEENYKKYEDKKRDREKQSLLQTVKKEEQLLQAEEEIKQLESDIHFQEDKYELETKNFNKNKDEEEKEFNQAKANEINQLNQEIEKRKKQLNYMKQYQQRKIQYEKDIEQLKNDIYQGNEEFEKDQRKQHEAFQNKRMEKEKETQLKIEKRKEQAKRDAEAKIKHSKQTIKENEKLEEELELHETEIEQLTIERDQILKENDSFKQDLSQNSIGISEYQNINHKQSVKIKKLNEKIEYLNNFILNEVQNYPEKLEKARQKYQQQMEDDEYEFKVLTDQLRKKIREIKHIKGLSQMILDQRTDIETFFLESLDIVKYEHLQARLKQQKMEEDLNDKIGSIKLPDISNKSSILQQQNLVNSQISTQGNDSIVKQKKNSKLDINQLDPEDKDRILKMVFQKMNSGVHAKSWRTYSQPNFDQSYNNNNNMNSIQSNSQYYN